MNPRLIRVHQVAHYFQRAPFAGHRSSDKLLPSHPFYSSSQRLNAPKKRFYQLGNGWHECLHENLDDGNTR
jgi:hypothetical protein